MSAHEQLRLLLDADMSSHSLVRILEEAGHDVLAAGLRGELKQLDDPILFAFAQGEQRIMITHNLADLPDILSEWAAAGRAHHGCILSTLPTNALGELKRGFELWFGQFPAPEYWLDRAVYLTGD
jgi:Domain of unknown function (DUF5615)